MVYYLHDGTPVGLLSALAAALRHGPVEKRCAESRIVQHDRFQPELFSETHCVGADPALAATFLRALAERLPVPVFRDLFPCFFAGEPDTGTALLTYVRLLLETDGKAADNWADETVRRMRKLSQRVCQEIHRLYGFLRFRRLEDGTYYATVEPDHAILSLLAPHFAARFADQTWLIHDLRRNAGVYYNGVNWVFLPKVEWQPELPGTHGGLGKGLAGLSADEEFYQGLWRAYFQQIAVPARQNPKLQRQHLPRRYWRNMVELNRD